MPRVTPPSMEVRMDSMDVAPPRLKEMAMSWPWKSGVGQPLSWLMSGP